MSHGARSDYLYDDKNGGVVIKSIQPGRFINIFYIVV